MEHCPYGLNRKLHRLRDLRQRSHQSANCTANGWSTCATSAGFYNTGGITMNGPIFSANYNGLQGQVTRNAGKNASLGLVYTYSHAFNYADNGAGTGSSGPAFAYPGYYKMNRAQANQDQKHNLQIWGICKPCPSAMARNG